MTDSKLDAFEFRVWRLLAHYDIPANVQTAVGTEVLNLAYEFLGIKPEAETPHHFARKYALGDAVHYFPKGDDMSRCGRALRSRLRATRITEDPNKTTCGHCRRWAKSDSEHGLIQLDSSENS